MTSSQEDVDVKKTLLFILFPFSLCKHMDFFSGSEEVFNLLVEFYQFCILTGKKTVSLILNSSHCFRYTCPPTHGHEGLRQTKQMLFKTCCSCLGVGSLCPKRHQCHAGRLLCVLACRLSGRAEGHRQLFCRGEEAIRNYCHKCSLHIPKTFQDPAFCLPKSSLLVTYPGIQIF